MSATLTPLPVLADHYDVGPPPWLLQGAYDADLATAAEMECPECGAVGLRLKHVYTETPTPQYRAFVTCGCGGFCEEI